MPPRIRTLKPEHKQHRKVGQLSDFEYRLWVGLITEADDEGRLVATPTSIRALIFPYQIDLPLEKVESALRHLRHLALIRAYTRQNTPYIDFPSWGDHQRINRPTPSKLPPYKRSHRDGLTEPSVNPSLSPHGALTTDRIGSEGKGSERSKRVVLTDDQFLDALRASPAYQGIDFDRELARMDAWLLTQPGRTRTRKFTVAWLNRIDRGMKPTPDRTDNGDRIGEPTRRAQYRELTDEEQTASLAEIRRLNRLSTHDAP